MGRNEPLHRLPPTATGSVIDLATAPKPGFEATFEGRTFLGRYKVLRFLGEGSNAHVFLASELTDPRVRVVVKRIKDEATAAPRFRQFFDSEVRSMRRFHHPYAVRLVDASLDDPLGACLVMEHIAGVTLEVVMAREPRMTPDRVGRLLGPLAHALHAAQVAGIAHRDLKPANLMVTGHATAAESLKVMDFGFAGFTHKPHIQMSELTGQGKATAFGTPAYVSPEMIRGDSTDARADIYSVGVILYELLTGRLPFDYDDTQKLLLAHTKDPPPSFQRAGCHTVSPAVEGVVQVALSKYPSERPATMKALADLYSRAIGRDIWEAATPAGYAPDSLADAVRNADPNGSVIVEPTDDKFVLSDRFEACLPEKLAALKLKGFIDEVGGQVAESEPGLVRVRVELPAGWKDGAPAKRPGGSGVFAFLSGVVRTAPNVTSGREPIEIELQMQKVDANRVAVLVAFRPVKPFLPTDADLWGERCEAYYSVLRKYVMPE